MSQEDPVWKRVLGGLVGITIMMGLIVYAAKRGATGKDIEHVQEILVYAGAAAGLVFFLWKKRKR